MLMSLVYYAGHGIELDGTSYLISIGATFERFELAGGVVHVRG
jgi:uncharacterized caspase-like protein